MEGYLTERQMTVVIKEKVLEDRNEWESSRAWCLHHLYFWFMFIVWHQLTMTDYAKPCGRKKNLSVIKKKQRPRQVAQQEHSIESEIQC